MMAPIPLADIVYEDVEPVFGQCFEGRCGRVVIAAVECQPARIAADPVGRIAQCGPVTTIQPDARPSTRQALRDRKPQPARSPGDKRYAPFQ